MIYKLLFLCTLLQDDILILIIEPLSMFYIINDRYMKLLIFISLFGGLLLASCGSSSSQKNASTQEVNPADTIYLGDLREKFEGDSIFFKVVAPDLMLMDYQYFWAATESEAVEKGLTKEYYKRVKKEISETNEAIKKGVMKGADVKRIPDFQEGQKK